MKAGLLTWQIADLIGDLFWLEDKTQSSILVRQCAYGRRGCHDGCSLDCPGVPPQSNLLPTYP